MIKKIKKIHNFGSFKDFNADETLEPFAKYNLFFAYNGSGKTTLSRFLSALSNGEGIPLNLRSEGYQEDFEVELDGNPARTITNFNEYTKCIKVFNTDFIKNEINFDESSLTTISVDFGKEQQDTKKRIACLEKRLLNLFEKDVTGNLTEKYAYTKEFNDAETSIKNICRDQAEEIRSEANIANTQSYNATNFERDLKNYEMLAVKLTVSEKDFRTAQKVSKQAIIDEIKYKNNNHLILTTDLVNKINEMLQIPMKRNDVSIKQDILDWIEKGTEFNIEENENKCYFCNSPITDFSKRLDEIKEIIKKDVAYEQYEKDFNGIQNLIKQNIEQLSLSSFLMNNVSEISELQFLDNNKDKFNTISSAIKSYTALYIQTLKDIVMAMNEKQSNYLNIEFEPFNYEHIDNLKKTILELERLIENNNNSLKDIDKQKNDAKEIIITYHVQNTIEDYLKFSTDREEAIDKQKRVKILETKIKKQLRENQIKLEKHELAIETIEKYIEFIFTYKKFKFIFNKETSSYKILREDGTPALNLSEGEKTVMAFAYFLATLKDKNFRMKNSIIVIDDPISSLDQNYLYNLLIMLIRFFNSPSKFDQLFVFTHNFYFFKKIRDIISHIGRDPNIGFGKYLVEKNSTSSIIKNATDALNKYQSEYLAEIENLKSWYSQSDLQDDVKIGVAIRKVFEIFLTYHAPLETSLYSKFNKVFTEEIGSKYRYLENIANASCHTDEIDDLDSMETFKLNVGKREIMQLFAFMWEYDENHAKALALPQLTS